MASKNFKNIYTGTISDNMMNEDEFISEVQQELTVSCALPF